MSAFFHEYLARAFGKKAEFDFKLQELSHEIKEPCQSTISNPKKESVSTSLFKVIKFYLL